MIIMILDFNDNMGELNVLAQGSELASVFAEDKDENGNRTYNWPDTKTKHIHTFIKPVLITDSFQIAQLTPTLRDSLFALFQSPKKEVRYHGTSIKFDTQKYPGVWSPSIDTILFTKALLQLNLTQVKTAVEVGAGSGFIAKFILKHNINLEQIELIDLNCYAMDCWIDNICDAKAKFFVGNATEIMSGKKYDLIVCNPPYIPRPKSIDGNPYEGIVLIQYLINQAKNLLNPDGRLLLNFSSLSIEQADKIIEKNNLQSTIITSMNVPLKVYNVLNNPVWMNYLEKHGLRKEYRDGYEYWQKITIVEIKVT